MHHSGSGSPFSSIMMSWNCHGQVGLTVPVTLPLGVPISTTSASSAMMKSADMMMNAVLSAMMFWSFVPILILRTFYRIDFSFVQWSCEAWWQLAESYGSDACAYESRDSVAELSEDAFDDVFSSFVYLECYGSAIDHDAHDPDIPSIDEYVFECFFWLCEWFGDYYFYVSTGSV